MKSITTSELVHRLDGESPPFLLDVREPEELVDGVIDGSVSVPLREVRHRLGELPKDRDIVVICHLGVRSAYVTEQLNALGYDRAVNLAGGMDSWIREIGPIDETPEGPA